MYDARSGNEWTPPVGYPNNGSDEKTLTLKITCRCQDIHVNTSTYVLGEVASANGRIFLSLFVDPDLPIYWGQRHRSLR